MKRGLRQVARRTGGVAYLELFTSDDSFEGATNWPAPRPARWYREVMARAGLCAIGMQLYVTDAARDRVSALERIP